MESIIWYQDPLNRGADVISYNGKSITPLTCYEYKKLFDVLYSMDKKTRKEKWINKTLIGDIPDGFYMKGYFIEKDNQDRNIGFMYYSDTKNRLEFEKRFRNEIRACGKSCTKAVFETIRQKSTKLPLFLAGALIVAVLLMVAFLIYLHNH